MADNRESATKTRKAPTVNDGAMTPPQLRALRALAAICDSPLGTAQIPSGYATPTDVAWGLWPESKAWGRRTNRGSTPAGGAVGATMPMNAATLLWRLCRLGYAVKYDRRWSVTPAGRRALSENPEPPGVTDSAVAPIPAAAGGPTEETA